MAVADGGSNRDFVEFLKAENFLVLRPKRKGLVAQVQESLKAAARNFSRPYILYTEPDKLPFFENGLRQFVADVPSQPSLAVGIAARDRKSFLTFPEYQQRTESAMNDFAELIFRKKGDYCYGPLLISTEEVNLIDDAPDDLGWGWRFLLFSRIQKSAKRIKLVKGYFPCPKDQRRESPGDRIYRVKQLRQNLNGLFLGME